MVESRAEFRRMWSQGDNAAIHLIRSCEMRAIVEGFTEDLENSVSHVRSSRYDSDRAVQVAFLEPLIACLELVYPGGKQTATGADQSTPWVRREHGATEGVQMTSAAPEIQSSGWDVEDTLG